MTKHEPDRQEVIMLIDLIEAPYAPVESKLKAIKRLEYITGRDIPGTKEFRRIRDEYTKPVVDKSETALHVPAERSETHVETKTKRTRHTPTGKSRRHE